jgi:hypothetical protein
MKKQIAWIFGGATVLCMGMVASLNACSNNNGGTDGGTKDAALDTKGDVSTNPDSGPGDAGSDVVTTADCGSIPTLHPTEAGTIFCGYPPDGGPSFSCTTGNQCCLGGHISGNQYAPEKCVGFDTVCDNPAPDGGSPIQCGQNSDCTANNKAGDVCCLQGAGAPAQVAGCSYYKSQGGNAIMCETPSNGACTGATDIQICSSDADCPSGKTCTPMKWKLYQMGFCL